MKKLYLLFAMAFIAIAAQAWTVKFTNPNNWANVSVYTFSPELCGGWPGKAMTKGADGVWTYTGTGTITSATKIIFNDTDGSHNPKQTGNLDLVDGATYDMAGVVGAEEKEYTVYFDNTDNWPNVYVWGWDTFASYMTGGYPGVKLEKGSNGYYAWTIKSTSATAPTGTGFQFNNGLSGDDERKTGDITNFADGNIYLPSGALKGDDNGDDNNDLEIYVVGAKNDWNNHDANYKMTKTGDNVYTITASNIFGGEWKLCNGTWDWTFGMGDSLEPNVDNQCWFDGQNFKAITSDEVTLTFTLVAGSAVKDSGIASYVKYTTGGEILPTYPTACNIIGYVNEDNNWNATGLPLTASDDEGVFTGTINLYAAGDVAGTTYFRFKADDVEYGPTGEGVVVAANGTYPLVKGENYQSFNYSSTVWPVEITLTVNLKTLEFSVGKIAGVEGVVVDANAPVEYFNLQGVRVSNPENGLYIVRQGNTVNKVYVK